MTKIEELGFISDEANLLEDRIVKSHSELFQLSEEISGHFLGALKASKIDSTSRDNLLLNACAARTLELFQSVDILLRKGCLPAAKSVCRTQLEAVYRLCAIHQDSSLIQSYIDQSKFSRLQKLKSTQKYKRKYPKSNAIPDLMKQIEKLSSEVKSINKVQPHQWADLAKMEDFHNTYYQGFSDDVHGNIETLDHYFDENNSHAFCFSPGEKDIYLVALASQKGTVNALAYYSHTAAVELSSVLEELNGKVESVFHRNQA